MLHAIFYCIWFIFYVVFIFSANTSGNANDFWLFLITVPYVLYEIALLVFSMRLQKYNVIQGLVRTLYEDHLLLLVLDPLKRSSHTGCFHC
jgi:hypothetical protein